MYIYIHTHTQTHTHKYTHTEQGKGRAKGWDADILKSLLAAKFTTEHDNKAHVYTVLCTYICPCMYI